MKTTQEAPAAQYYQDTIRALTDELSKAKQDAEYWKSLFLGIRQRHYGRSTEIAGQMGLDLFDEAEAQNTADVLDHTEGEVTGRQVAGYTRRIAKNGVMELDPSTPVVDVRHDGIAPVCGCGSAMRLCGEFVRDALAMVPARKLIVRHHYPQYACPACLPDPGEPVRTTVVDQGDVLGGTICDPSLLATIVTDKMQFGLPLYRQEQRFPAGDGRITRQAMSAWFMLAGRALAPLGEALERLAHTYPLWNCDETGVRVLRVPAPGHDPGKDGGKAPPGGPDDGKDGGLKDKARNCFMVVRAATAADRSRGPVVFTFQDRRTNAGLAALLKDYQGVCQTDGLAGYEHAREKGSFTHLCCFVHARRKVADIFKKSKKNATAPGKNSRADLPRELLKLYGTFFHHEGQLLDAQKGTGALDDGRFLAVRRELLGKDLDAIKAWLDRYKIATLKGSEMRQAIMYALDRWDALTRFLDYPYATSGNNLAENCIRPFVIGRKGFLFCITPQGAEVSALFYSLVESCKAMGINPHAYLCHVLSHAGSCRTDADWDALLPGRADLSGMGRYYAMLQDAKADPNRTTPYIVRGKKPAH